MKQSIDPNLIQDIIDIMTYIATAAIGWFARWLARGKQEKAMNTENKQMKNVIMHYDKAARDALKTARKPGPLRSPGSVGDNIDIT